MKKNIIFIIFALLILPITFSEILVQTTEGELDQHQFIVNKYYFQQSQPQLIEENSAILIQPNVSEKTISQCSQTEYSFNLANPTQKTQTYLVKIKDFEGIAYLPPNLIIPKQEIRKINIILMPNCKFTGIANPKVIVETSEEKAELPLLLDVLPVKIDTMTEEDCLFYYNESVCNSENYVRFYQGTRYTLDLDNLFYDPDGDKLEYSADSFNLNVKIRDGKAIITPLYDFYGKEEVIFFADDNKGGQAQSQTFYFHVLSNGRSFLENFVLLNMPMLIVILVLIFLILLVMAFVIRPSEKKEQEEIPEPPENKKGLSNQKKSKNKKRSKLKKK